MRKKETIMTFRPTEKNRVYLSRLGFLDLRTGNVRKDGPELSKFLNICITMICESQKVSELSQVSSEELYEAYRKFNIAIKTAELDKLNKEIQDLISKRLEVKN